ncbi:MAG: hypothetical protein F6K49_27495 [Moorea sp. SIO3I6]|nr:hypothetical protein [Moorena sp. SIO3I6]
MFIIRSLWSFDHLVEWASWVELASCQLPGMGILGGTGILPVSCLFSGGQDAHSTSIHSLIQQRPLTL